MLVKYYAGGTYSSETFCVSKFMFNYNILVLLVYSFSFTFHFYLLYTIFSTPPLSLFFLNYTGLYSSNRVTPILL